MFEEFFKVLKSLALFSLAVLGLGILGAFLNSIIPWFWLVYFFVILRSTVSIFDFTWHIPTLLTLVGIALSVEIAIWSWRATMTIVKWFKSYRE